MSFIPQIVFMFRADQFLADVKTKMDEVLHSLRNWLSEFEDSRFDDSFQNSQSRVSTNPDLASDLEYSEEVLNSAMCRQLCTHVASALCVLVIIFCIVLMWKSFQCEDAVWSLKEGCLKMPSKHMHTPN